MSSSSRRKTSNPQRLAPPAANPPPDSSPPQEDQLLSARLGLIIADLCRLTSDLALSKSQDSTTTSATFALEFLTSAHRQLLGGLGCLRQLEDEPPSQPQETLVTAVNAECASDHSDQTVEIASAKPVETQVSAAAPLPQVKRKKQLSMPNKVDPNFIPLMSMDGRSVTLSAKHPSVKMTTEAHQRLLWSSRGVATLHLRGLLKHFFSRDVLAESSITGVGAYKRQLDKDIVLAICDHISSRYPGALSESRMRLCCTDVCVQARRRRRNRDSCTVGGSVSVDEGADDGDTSG